MEVDNAVQELRELTPEHHDNVEMVAVIGGELPLFKVPLAEALHYAWQEQSRHRMVCLQQLQSESSVAQAKASRGLKADLYMQVGRHRRQQRSTTPTAIQWISSW